MIKLIKKIFNYFFKFEFIRFGFVGFWNTVIDFGILNTLIFLFSKNDGIYFLIFRGIALIIATAFSFFFNKHFTFKNKDKHTFIQGTKFYVITASLIILSNLVFSHFFLNFFNAHLYLEIFNISPDLLNKNLAAFCGLVLTIIARYFLFKYFVFKKK